MEPRRRPWRFWKFVGLLLAARWCGAAELLAVGTEFSKVFEQSTDGEVRGLGVDIVNTLAARAGDTVRFQIFPWPRAQAMVREGRADLLVGPYNTPERRFQFAFLDQPFYRDRMVFFARRGAAPPWQGDYGALKGRRIAVLRGWRYGASFEQARAALNLDDVGQLENGAGMLARGRVELLAANERNARPILEALHLDAALVALEPPIGIQDGYLAFSNRPQLESTWLKYNRLFNQMVQSGELAKLAAKYGVTIPARP